MTTTIAHVLTLGDGLAEARKAASLTQTELGRRTGVPNSRISEYEAGKKLPSVATLLALSRELGPFTLDAGRADDSRPANVPGLRSAFKL